MNHFRQCAVSSAGIPKPHLLGGALAFYFPVPVLAESHGLHFQCVNDEAQASNEKPLPEMGRTLAAGNSIELTEGITAPRQSANRPAKVIRKAVGMPQSRHAATGCNFR